MRNVNYIIIQRFRNLQTIKFNQDIFEKLSVEILSSRRHTIITFKNLHHLIYNDARHVQSKRSQSIHPKPPDMVIRLQEKLART